MYARHLGRTPTQSPARLEARVLSYTLKRKPADGSTHRSSRKLAAERCSASGASTTFANNALSVPWSPTNQRYFEPVPARTAYVGMKAAGAGRWKELAVTRGLRESVAPAALRRSVTTLSAEQGAEGDG